MNLSAYFVEVSGILRKRLLPVVVFSGLFLVGILSGIVIDKPVAIEYYYLDYCDEYVYRIFSAPVWSIFPARILNCILFLVPAAYEILLSNGILEKAKLSRQTGYNSGAEVQIPYLLILCSALLMIYDQRVNSTRLAFIDEPFAKMDPGNVKRMLHFMREQNLQMIFCSPDKTELIGDECQVILPALRVRPDCMRLGIVQFHEEKEHGGV